jgi:hypothetical protein
MEERFHHDFSRVRVHSAGQAADSARRLGALAYTTSGHIVFGANRYKPETVEGRRLIAHELAHVVQAQRNGVDNSSSAESEAKRAAWAFVATWEKVGLVTSVPATTLLCDSELSGPAPRSGSSMGGSKKIPHEVAKRGRVSRGSEPEPLDVGRFLIAELVLELPLIKQARQIAAAYNCTVAVGLESDLAAVIGVTDGAGFYAGPDGDIGVYATLGADIGADIGASIGAAFAVIKGPPEAFAGPFLQVTFGAGAVPAVSVTGLFGLPSGKYLGVAGTVGVSAGIPFSAYVSLTDTWIDPIDLPVLPVSPVMPR